MARNTLGPANPPRAPLKAATVAQPVQGRNKHPNVIAAQNRVVNHVVHRYKIIDPTHLVDAKGEFAGTRVIQIGPDKFVNLTEAQAKFYLDSQSIALAPGS